MEKKTRNTLIGVAVVLVAIYSAGIILKKLRKPSEEELNRLNMDLVLQKGSTGSEVAELQRILKDELGYNLGSTGVDVTGIDGEFGALTEKALFEAKGVKEITLKEMRNEKE